MSTSRTRALVFGLLATAVLSATLTVAGLEGPEVMVAVIPHTAQVTTLGGMAAGREMNVEVDVLAKYVERMLGDRAKM